MPGAKAGPANRAPDACPAFLIPCCSMEDMAMRTLDPTQLSRSTIGFDRIFDLLNQSRSWPAEDNYPPYNIERTGDDQFRISLALAGFGADDVTITAEQNVLVVEGAKAQPTATEYLYQG